MRAGAAFALAVAATAALAGCGGGSREPSNGVASKPPRQILDVAVRALESAHSVHVRGSVDGEGRSVAVDLSLVAGEGARGTFDEGSDSVNVIAAGSRVYVQTGRRSPAGAGASGAQTPAAGWASTSASDPRLQGFADFRSLDALAQALDVWSSKLSKRVVTVGGRPAVAIRDEAGGGQTLYVATTGRPYPLALSQSGAMTGRFSFSQYGQPMAVTAPKNVIAADGAGSFGS